MEITDWVDFNGDSISIPPDADGHDRDITEHLGESLALSTINRIHGLTAADWDRIRPQSFSTFDFQFASDGQWIIQVEAKGSVAANNRLLRARR